MAGVWSPDGHAAAADDARPELRVLRIDSGTPGLTLQPMPATRFVPEVPHASVLLHDVRVPMAAMLPGDGYADYVKPFRTVEDVHVMLAIGACLLREARSRAWPPAFAERLLAVLAVSLRTVHGLLAESLALWPADADDEAAARWRRDGALFQVAGAAREQRARRAWEMLAGR